MEASSGSDFRQREKGRGNRSNEPKRVYEPAAPAAPQEPKREITHESIEVQADELRHNKPVYRLNKKPAEAIVVHCGDPRFQDAFRRFISEELGIATYVPIIIGGGLHAFGVQSFLPKNLKILWEQLKFFVKQGNVRHLIFINHEDCRWYENMKSYHPGKEMKNQARMDLVSASKRVLEDFGGVDVRTFMAELHGDEVVFQEV